MITNCIIVGLDDSAASRAAHRWAAAYAYATGKDLHAVHVLDWPIGLDASAVKSGTRLCVPKQDIAEPYRRGMHHVFDDTGFPPGSLSSPKETSAMSWCASAPTPTCWSSVPVSRSGAAATSPDRSATTASATPAVL